MWRDPRLVCFVESVEFLVRADFVCWVSREGGREGRRWECDLLHAAVCPRDGSERERLGRFVDEAIWSERGGKGSSRFCCV